MSETVLITGASGLLGRALVDAFVRRGIPVLAQYHRRRGGERGNVRWLAGDFSSSRSTAAFLKRHAAALAECVHVIHNYGPIVQKDTAAVTGADLLAAFQVHLQPALDITRFLLAHARLRSALFVAFEHTGRLRSYRRILAYALAKNALPVLSRSLAASHPGIRFSVYSPPTLAGAAVQPPGARPVAPPAVAETIFRVFRRRSGGHFRRETAGGRQGRKHG
ncbi:MAG: SDR family oxidoreductase [Acidobacteria bacterium]|jgi:NAD(P)-dependent dehydrogenase (short-subunit alcohol dehydrogenase family)|nr:SDR family oxidoreductase [Acidobacteriota bacterium]